MAGMPSATNVNPSTLTLSGTLSADTVTASTALEGDATGRLVPPIVILTPAASVTVDLSLGRSFRLTPDQDTAIGFSNFGDGMDGIILRISTDGVSHNLTWSNVLNNPGSIPTGTSAGQEALFLYYSRGGDVIEILHTAFLP